MRLRLGSMSSAALFLSVVLLSGCGSDSSVRVPSGKVVQGPVKGAIVFADRIVAGHITGDFVVDSSEAASEVLTGDDGSFALPVVPSYSYVTVSRGGTDTSTGLSAIQMSAPAGADNISPLTTLVALNPASQARIEALGVKYDADISSSSTSAALLLAKSVEATIKTLTDSLAAAGGSRLTSAQVAEIQYLLAASIASEVGTSGVDLTDPSVLKSVFTTALTTAIAEINASPTLSNISIGNGAAVAAAISDVISTIAAQLSPISTSGAIVETVLFTPTSGATTAITTAMATISASSQVASSMTVLPPAIDTTPPTVTAVAPAENATGVALTSTITATFSEPVDSTTFSLGGLAGTIIYNAFTNTVTLTPAAPLAANTTYTVTIGTNVKDLAGNALAAPKTWSFTTLAPTGATGGSSAGTGIAF